MRSPAARFDLPLCPSFTIAGTPAGSPGLVVVYRWLSFSTSARRAFSPSSAAGREPARPTMRVPDVDRPIRLLCFRSSSSNIVRMFVWNTLKATLSFTSSFFPLHDSCSHPPVPSGEIDRLRHDRASSLAATTPETPDTPDTPERADTPAAPEKQLMPATAAVRPPRGLFSQVRLISSLA